MALAGLAAAPADACAEARLAAHYVCRAALWQRRLREASYRSRVACNVRATGAGLADRRSPIADSWTDRWLMPSVWFYRIQHPAIRDRKQEW